MKDFYIIKAVPYGTNVTIAQCFYGDIKKHNKQGPKGDSYGNFQSHTGCLKEFYEDLLPTINSRMKNEKRKLKTIQDLKDNTFVNLDLKL